MGIYQSKVKCERCGGEHTIEVNTDTFTKGQLNGTEPILNFVCPDIAMMYRVVGFAFDFIVNNVKPPNASKDIIDKLKLDWGENNFDAKLSRFIKLDLSFIGVSDEYYYLLRPIIDSYCCGYYYPAITSSGTLGERILNRLLLKTRNYFKSSPHYKKVHNKMSLDRWEYLVEVLTDWQIITRDIGDLFLELKGYRNDSIHYNDGYDFETNSHKAIKALAGIINGLFNYMNRGDLFWLFDCPGEIWVRSSVLNNPFVIEFVLPQALPLTPFCEPLAEPPIRGTNAPIKPLSDEEFIRIRNGRTQ